MESGLEKQIEEVKTELIKEKSRSQMDKKYNSNTITSLQERLKTLLSFKEEENKRENLKQQILQLKEQNKILEKQKANILSEFDLMKEEINTLREYKAMVQEHKCTEYLYFETDNENFLESCVGSVPIVIRADDLRLLLSKS